MKNASDPLLSCFFKNAFRITSHNNEWSCSMRTTLDPKNEKIKLRLNEDLKAHVEECANRKGVSLSEYVRELIRQDMKSKNNKR